METVETLSGCVCLDEMLSGRDRRERQPLLLLRTYYLIVMRGVILSSTRSPRKRFAKTPNFASGLGWYLRLGFGDVAACRHTSYHPCC